MVHLAYLGQGNNYHVKKWLTALADVGLRVTLISFTEPDKPIDGVEFRKIDPPFGGRVSDLHLWHFWGSAAPLRQLLNEIEADVLMASYATHYGFLGARTGFRPLIAQTWTADLTMYPVSGWKHWILGPIVRRSLRDADVITTDGPALAEQGRELFPDLADRIKPFRWGIRTDQFEFPAGLRHEVRQGLGIPVDAPVVTSPRGVLAWYRPAVILQAFLDVLESHPQVYAIFLTLGRERDAELESLLQRFGDHARARLIDRFIPSEKMREIWAITDVLVSVPVVDGVSEGLLEGMYCGCIPLVSDIPSNRSIIEQGVSGVIVGGDLDSPETLASSLRTLLADLDETQPRIAQRNRLWVAENASVNVTAEKMAQLVRGLMKFA